MATYIKNIVIETVNEVDRSPLKDIITGVNKAWPGDEGIYATEDFKPDMLAAYALLVLFLENPDSCNGFAKCVDLVEVNFSKNIMELIDKTTKPHYRLILATKDTRLKQKQMAYAQESGKYAAGQFLDAHGNDLLKPIDDWVERYFNPKEYTFDNVEPMREFCCALIMHDTLMIPAFDKNIAPYIDKEKLKEPHATFLMNINRKIAEKIGAGFVDPGTWELLKKKEYYQTIGWTREQQRENSNEARKQLKLIKAKLYKEKALVKGAYCFIRACVEGDDHEAIAKQLNEWLWPSDDEHPNRETVGKSEVSNLLKPYALAFGYPMPPGHPKNRS